jgi:hypothetical protein
LKMLTFPQQLKLLGVTGHYKVANMMSDVVEWRGGGIARLGEIK